MYPSRLFRCAGLPSVSVRSSVPPVSAVPFRAVLLPPPLLGSDRKGAAKGVADKDKKKEGKRDKDPRWTKMWPREILRKEMEASVAPRLDTPKDVKRFLKKLSPEERELLVAALAPGIRAAAAEAQQEESNESAEEGDEVSKPSWQELYRLALHQSLPFVGFGILDNGIMITAGDMIDTKLGLTLGISTMAAAGLGNAISDVFGLGLAWYVELLASKIGIRPPALTIEQLELSSARAAANIGRALGCTLGCLIGMFPLLFK